MFFSRWEPARAILAWSGQRVSHWVMHRYAVGCAERRCWYLPFVDGFILYAWSPYHRELTLWEPVPFPGFHKASYLERMGAVEMALRKVTDTPAAFKEPSDVTAKKRWPELWDHLTARAYDDEAKTPRQTSTITLFCRDDGQLAGTLNDRDNGRACFAVAPALMLVLDTLEAVASNPATVWREDRQQTGSSKRKKNG